MSSSKADCGHLIHAPYERARTISLEDTNCEECACRLFTVCSTCYEVYREAGRIKEEKGAEI